MGKTEWTWKTKDGLELQAVAWLPQGEAKGLVCMVHGMGEHMGRYEADAAALNAAGYVFAGFDQRGFGRSQGQRGHTPSIESYFDDIDAFIEEATRRWPLEKRFLHGMSMGGLLVLAYTPTRRPALTGVIASSPGLKTAIEQQKAKLAAAKVFGLLFPTLSMNNGLDLSEICRDPKVAEAFAKDPLGHRVVTAGWGRAMLRGISIANANAPAFPLPLLMLLGSEDKIAYPEGGIAFVEAAPKDKATLKVFEGFKHELRSDPEKERVFQAMIDWMEGL